MGKTTNHSQATPGHILAEGARTFGLSLTPAQISAFEAYLAQITSWNRRVNLTSIRDPALMVRRHLLDCLSVVRYLDHGHHIIDVGSGAGLPGIVIKILLPQKRVTLLECRRRRANFLRHVVRALNLRGTDVLEERLECLTVPRSDLFGETIARAFTDNEGFLRASARVLAPGGKAILMHGPTGHMFLQQRGALVEELGLEVLPPADFALPFGGERRTVLFFAKP